MSIILPKDGTWKFSGNARVYVGDAEKCAIGINNGATITVAGGKLKSSTGIYKRAEGFTSTYSYQGSERRPYLGFTCNTPTITVNGNVVTFKVWTTPHGPHIHVPYAGGRMGSITRVVKQ